LPIFKIVRDERIKVAASGSLELAFGDEGFSLGGMGLKVYQFPGAFSFCVTGKVVVMLLKPFF
jgi:hypothetical protein